MIYGVTAFGFTLHMHYCCGKLDKVSLVAAKDACPYGQGIKSKGCCDNKEYHFAIKADQEVSNNNTITCHARVVPCILSPFTFFSFSYYQSPLHPTDTGPPVLASTLPLFIQYSVYRI